MYSRKKWRLPIVVVSDTHIGSDVGLVPPAARLDRGGHYELNRAQRWLWEKWAEFWAAVWSRTRDYIFVHLGDVVDGVHHGGREAITENLAIQTEMAVALLKDPCRRARFRFFLRGTTAHAGLAAETEEMIARELDASRDPETGAYTWYDLTLRHDGQVIHMAHHMPVSLVLHYQSTPLMREMFSAICAAAHTGNPPPQVYVRAHSHTYVSVRTSMYRAVAVPPWQLRTSYSYRRGVYTLTVGGIVIYQDDGHLHIRELIWPVPGLFKPIRVR